MAEIVETLPDGTRVYDNGMHIGTNGKIIKAPAPEYRGISAENARELRRMQHEQYRARVAENIALQSRAAGRLVQTGVDAMADAAGILWRDIVLDKRAPARERRQTYDMLAKHADMIQQHDADDTPPGGATIKISAETAREIIAAALQARASNGSGDDV